MGTAGGRNEPVVIGEALREEQIPKLECEDEEDLSRRQDRRRDLG